MDLIGAYASDDEEGAPAAPAAAQAARPALPTADQAFGVAATGAVGSHKRHASGATVLQQAQSKQGARGCSLRPPLRLTRASQASQRAGQWHAEPAPRACSHPSCAAGERLLFRALGSASPRSLRSNSSTQDMDGMGLARSQRAHAGALNKPAPKAEGPG